MPFVGLALQVFPIYWANEWLEPAIRFFIIASYFLLLAFVVANWRSIGIAVIGIGLVLNFMAIMANGGYMPVTEEALAKAGLQELAASVAVGEMVPGSKDIFVASGSSRLYPLTDIVTVKWPWPTVASAGDFIVGLGLVVVLIQGCRRLYVREGVSSDKAPKGLGNET
ncbi:MAG: DUF5317 domain-containing protein [Dehalococcoidia bacterium]